MRRALALLFLIALLGGLLSACSAGWNAVPGIGLDASAHLVGAVKVCDHTISRASIRRADDSTVGSWTRQGSLRHTEIWELAAPWSGAWKSDVRLPAALPSGDGLTFAASRDDDAYNSRWIIFHKSDIDSLKPGEMLVNRQVQKAHGDVTTVLKVIAMAEFGREACPQQ